MPKIAALYPDLLDKEAWWGQETLGNIGSGISNAASNTWQGTKNLGSNIASGAEGAYHATGRGLSAVAGLVPDAVKKPLGAAAGFVGNNLARVGKAGVGLAATGLGTQMGIAGRIAGKGLNAVGATNWGAGANAFGDSGFAQAGAGLKDVRTALTSGESGNLSHLYNNQQQQLANTNAPQWMKTTAGFGTGAAHAAATTLGTMGASRGLGALSKAAPGAVAAETGAGEAAGLASQVPAWAARIGASGAARIGQAAGIGERGLQLDEGLEHAHATLSAAADGDPLGAAKFMPKGVGGSMTARMPRGAQNFVAGAQRAYSKVPESVRTHAPELYKHYDNAQEQVGEFNAARRHVQQKPPPAGWWDRMMRGPAAPALSGPNSVGPDRSSEEHTAADLWKYGAALLPADEAGALPDPDAINPLVEEARQQYAEMGLPPEEIERAISADMFPQFKPAHPPMEL
jgi:hypothetical protein